MKKLIVAFCSFANAPKMAIKMMWFKVCTALLLYGVYCTLLYGVYCTLLYGVYCTLLYGVYCTYVIRRVLHFRYTACTALLLHGV